jgi:hypothetical protein
MPLLSVNAAMLDFIPNASGCGPTHYWVGFQIYAGPVLASYLTLSAVIASEERRQFGKPRIAAPMGIASFRAVAHEDAPQVRDGAPSTVLLDQSRDPIPPRPRALGAGNH